MKNRYEEDGGYIVGYFLSGRTYWIGDLWVHPTHRRRHIATRLMSAVCEHADQERIVLRLDPVPDGTIAYCDLCDFYATFGFYLYAGIMERRPK